MDRLVAFLLIPIGLLQWLTYLPCEAARKKAEAVYSDIIWNDPFNLLKHWEYELLISLAQLLWILNFIMGGQAKVFDRWRKS